MRAVVIEDEEPSLELMKRLIRKNDRLELVGAYTDPQKALKDIPRLAPDVLFLDVEMPGVTGLEMARRIRAGRPGMPIVFVTAYEKYALDAFRVDAVNYLLKPLTEEDLRITVDRLMQGRRPAGRPDPQNRQNRIEALGKFEVFGEKAGETVVWPTAKTRELFACFVVGRGGPLDKWLLCERLWPRFAPMKAEHNLHSTVSRMKRSLRAAGISAPLICAKGRYRMDLGGCTCDMWELADFMAGNPSVSRENLAEYEKMLALYEGDLFGMEDYPWCLEDREKLHMLHLAGLKRAGRCYLENGDARQAAAMLQKAFREDPLDEEAAGLLMRAFARTGDREMLVECYDRLGRSLAAELGVGPKAATSRLYTDLMRQN